MFGIAILAAVFAAHGSCASPASFVAGFRPAEWVAAAMAATGVIAAALAPGKARAGRSAEREPQPVPLEPAAGPR